MPVFAIKINSHHKLCAIKSTFARLRRDILSPLFIVFCKRQSSVICCAKSKIGSCNLKRMFPSFCFSLAAKDSLSVQTKKKAENATSAIFRFFAYLPLIAHAIRTVDQRGIYILASVGVLSFRLEPAMQQHGQGWLSSSS